jgi:hypothetical protein
MKKWVITVEQDEYGNLVLPFNQEILDLTKWKEGDIIEWVDNKDGSWTMKLKDQEKFEWVMVETVQMFRHRYMVQVPAGKAEWALDTVTCEEAKEFSQKHIGETITSHRVMSYEDAIELCDEDNDYARVWADDRKVDAFFTKEGEKVNV